MLSPAYFSPNYKYFDQLLQTVKNKTTVFKLYISFQRVLTNINSTTDFCTLCKKESLFSVEKFRRGTRLRFRKFRASKNIMSKRGILRLSIDNLLSHSTEKLRRGTLLCFTKFLVSKKFMVKWGGGVSRFSVKNFLSHSAEKFRRGTLQCVTNFGYRKILCFKELCHDFVSKFFCLTMPKYFIGEPFCAVFQKMSGSEEVYG